MELAAWAMVGVTAVLLTVTGVMALKVEDAEDQMTRLAVSRDPYTSLPYPYTGPYKSEYEKYEKDGKMYEKLTWTFAGLAGGAAVTAAILFTVNYLVKPKSTSKERPGKAFRLTPRVTHKGAAMGVAVDF
jgi:hypothetical protein